MEELINQYFYEKTVAKIQNFSLNYVETIKNFINLYKNSDFGIIGILPKEITGFTGTLHLTRIITKFSKDVKKLHVIEFFLYICST